MKSILHAVLAAVISGIVVGALLSRKVAEIRVG
jgi:hypothetical protein